MNKELSKFKQATASQMSWLGATAKDALGGGRVPTSVNTEPLALPFSEIQIQVRCQ